MFKQTQMVFFAYLEDLAKTKVRALPEFLTLFRQTKPFLTNKYRSVLEGSTHLFGLPIFRNTTFNPLNSPQSLESWVFKLRVLYKNGP